MWIEKESQIEKQFVFNNLARAICFAYNISDLKLTYSLQSNWADNFHVVKVKVSSSNDCIERNKIFKKIEKKFLF